MYYCTPLKRVGIVLEKRIEELEIKVSYQEDEIQTLNDVLLQQQKNIDHLQTLCAGLNERFTGMQASIQQTSDGEVPPHY